MRVHQNHAVLDGDAEERDEPDQRGHRQVQPGQRQGEKPADGGERHGEQNQDGKFAGVERDEEQEENRDDRDGHDDRQALFGALFIFK